MSTVLIVLRQTSDGFVVSIDEPDYVPDPDFGGLFRQEVTAILASAAVDESTSL
jgi:hypothetical protein